MTVRDMTMDELTVEEIADRFNKPKKKPAELEMMHLAKAGEHILTGDWHRVRIEQETAHADWHMAKAADYRRMMENNGI